jgi:hypothetical protein
MEAHNSCINNCSVAHRRLLDSLVQIRMVSLTVMPTNAFYMKKQKIRIIVAVGILAIYAASLLTAWLMN